MSSQWVDFAAIKGSVDIQQVLDHYRVRLKRVRQEYLRGLCPLPTHGSAQSLLVAAADGAIMAGPVGTTPPMVDGG